MKDLKMKEFTELFMEKLKGDVLRLQQYALSAINAGEYEKCKKALNDQQQHIEAIVKLTDTYNKRYEK